MGEIKESLVKGDSNNNKLTIENHTEVKLSKNEDKPYKRKILWWSVLVFSLMHAGAVYGLFLPKQWKTIAFGSCLRIYLICTSFNNTPVFSIIAVLYRWIWCYRWGTQVFYA